MKKITLTSTIQWMNCAVAVGDEVRVLATGTSGYLSNTDYPASPRGNLQIDGSLIADKTVPGTVLIVGGLYVSTTISKQGSLTIDGNGTYDQRNYVDFANTTTNNGTINISNSTVWGRNNGTLTGTGVLNLKNVKLPTTVNSVKSQSSFAYITGGQTVNMENSVLSVSTSMSDVTINMIGGNNLFAFTTTNTLSNVNIRGFGAGDTIDYQLGSGVETFTYDARTGDLVFNSGAYRKVVNIGLGYDPSLLALVPNPKSPGLKVLSYAGPTPCFLAGTKILTSAGWTLIENLKIGDKIATFTNGENAFSSAEWVGKGETHCNSWLPDDLSGFPVVIMKDALGDNVPHEDIRLTPEHCIFMDGVLIPCRMLVNGMSIYYDKSYLHYSYYHIKLQNHSIINANGMLTESLADTNHFSRNSDNESSQDAADLAAPLGVDPDIAEALHYRISRRATISGVTPKSIPSLAAHKPEVHLYADDKIVHPIRISGNRHVFMLPRNIGGVSIISSTTRPCDSVGPFINDRRALGVLIGKIDIFDSFGHKNLDIHTHTKYLSGWHCLENEQSRWTNGNAYLPLGERSTDNSISILSLEVLTTFQTPRQFEHCSGPVAEEVVSYSQVAPK